MPKSYDEQIHDAQMMALVRRLADALDAIAGTLAAIHDGLKQPVFITPKEVLEDGTLIYPAPGETPAEAIDAVVANPPIGEVVKDAPTPLDPKAPKMGADRGKDQENGRKCK